MNIIKGWISSCQQLSKTFLALPWCLSDLRLLAYLLYFCVNSEIYNAYWAAYIWPGPIWAKYCKINSSCVIYLKPYLNVPKNILEQPLIWNVSLFLLVALVGLLTAVQIFFSLHLIIASFMQNIEFQALKMAELWLFKYFWQLLKSSSLLLLLLAYLLYLCVNLEIYNACWATYIWPDPILAKYCKMNSSCIIHWNPH